jgi:hypothetical protein
MNAVAELKPDPKEQVKRVKPTSLQMSEHAFARYSVVAPVGWTIEDLLDPEAWAHVAHKLEKTQLTNEPDRSGAIIEVRTEDHAFYAELYVRAVRKMALDVDVIQFKPLGPQTEKKTAGFDVRWNVGARSFEVIRQSDKEVVARALPKKEDAYAWIERTIG